MTAMRVNVPLSGRINFFSPHWEDSIHKQARRHGQPQGSFGLDVFVYAQQALLNLTLPRFMVGVWRWDNPLLSEALLSADMAVVDASAAVLVVHMGGSSAPQQGAGYTARLGSQYADEIAHNASNHFFMIGARVCLDCACLALGRCSSFVAAAAEHWCPAWPERRCAME